MAFDIAKAYLEDYGLADHIHPAIRSGENRHPSL